MVLPDATAPSELCCHQIALSQCCFLFTTMLPLHDERSPMYDLSPSHASCLPVHGCLVAELASQLWQPCVDQPACGDFYWQYSAWVCSNPIGCGGGTAVRSAVCTNGTTGATLPDIVCANVTQDATTMPCATDPCGVLYWRARELTDCLPVDASKPCGEVSDVCPESLAYGCMHVHAAAARSYLGRSVWW